MAVINKNLVDKYTLNINNIVIEISIVTRDDKPVPDYIVSITNISDTTKIILEKIRQTSSKKRIWKTSKKAR